MKLLESIEYLLLPKLSKNYEEYQHPIENQIQRKIGEQFQFLMKQIQDLKLNDSSVIKILPYLLILYEELSCAGAWNTDLTREYSKKLHNQIEVLLDVKLDNILQNDKFDKQMIFNSCMEYLHAKLTKDDFKKYPSLVAVYCSIIAKVEDSTIQINPLKTLPISLILIDDYINENKIMGLKSCSCILQCLTSNDFQNGNYYEVIYESLQKNIVMKDLQVTKMVFDCFLKLLSILPADVKMKKVDDLFTIMLKELCMESNLHRKAVCFSYIQTLIEMLGADCARKKKRIYLIFCDNLEICKNEAISDILLTSLLECLETWIKHCWHIWKVTTDYKLLSVLFVILYTTGNVEANEKLRKIITTLISLSSQEENIQIFKNSDNLLQCRKGFLRTMEAIKRSVL